MINNLTSWADTIVAPATPPGIGALGIIRISGDKAFTIANELFPAKDLLQQPSHTLQVGILKNKDVVLDEVVLSLFRSPKSYTGEDVIEISCHGSAYIQQQIIKACLEKGARLAQAGEFTQRAFLNGKLDLAQAEAVADLIAADSKASQQTALNQLRGGFSTDLKELREQLINFAALIELELDFSEEDVAFADRDALRNLVEKIRVATQQLIDSFRLGNVIKNGIDVTIAGKPNAGKSTLLNALLNEERAIVSEIAGTTRDTIEETLTINGLIFRFTDTAGIRTHTIDTIEKIGIQKALDKINTSSILLYLADSKEENPASVFEQVNTLVKNIDTKPIIIFNKADLIPDPAQYNKWLETKENTTPAIPVFLMAVKNSTKGIHTIEDLKEALYQLVVADGINTENTIITNARHYHALQKVADCLHDIKTGMENNLSGDLLASDIRRCLHYLGEITGQVEVDRDILGTIFGKFCIGK